MNAEDKAEYHNSLIKNMTRKCHSKCFKVSDSKIDKNCLSGCYHKYINVMSKLRSLTEKEGDKLESEFVFTVFNPRYDPIIDLIWSKGGSRYMYGPPINWVLKFVIHKNITPLKGYSPYRDKYENQ